MTVLNWIPTAIAAVLFLGSAAVYLRGSRDKGTIEALERNNAALTERVGILESTGREDRGKITAQAQTIAVLTNTVNSADLIVNLKGEILEALNEHHLAAIGGVSQIHEDLANLPGQIAAVLKGNA